jgi:CHAD domain-containing protein
LLDEFRDIKKRLKGWRLDQKGWDAIENGLHRSYRDAREAMQDVIKHCDVESLHDWRKRVKDLRHQIELLIPAWPDELTKMEEEMHQLSDLLGDDHDLAVLNQSIPESLAVEREVLLGLVTARRTHLQRQAIPLGERLFAEKPAAFTKRLHEYWHAWRNE